jgi:hypothetical protein
MVRCASKRVYARAWVLCAMGEHGDAVPHRGELTQRRRGAKRSRREEIAARRDPQIPARSDGHGGAFPGCRDATTTVPLGAYASDGFALICFFYGEGKGWFGLRRDDRLYRRPLKVLGLAAWPIIHAAGPMHIMQRSNGDGSSFPWSDSHRTCSCNGFHLSSMALPRGCAGRTSGRHRGGSYGDSRVSPC